MSDDDAGPSILQTASLFVHEQLRAHVAGNTEPLVLGMQGPQGSGALPKSTIRQGSPDCVGHAQANRI